MNNNLAISIPADVTLEWQTEIVDGITANQWWQSLTKEQQTIMMDAGLLFLQKQKIKESLSKSDSLIPELIKLSQSAGCIELCQDKTNHYFLESYIRRDLYGVIGECYSQTPEFIGSVCEEFLGDYVGGTPKHQHGQHTVDVICFAINVLPGVTAAPTPANSLADVGLRWDVIIQWNNFYFPIQVKSSFQQIEEAREESSLGNHARKLIDELRAKSEKLERRHDKLHKHNYPQEYWQNRISHYETQQDILSMHISKYNNSSPLYIWASQNRQTVKLLVELFANTFNIGNNLQQYQEQAVEAYLEKYPDCAEKEKQRRKEPRLIVKPRKTEQAEQIIKQLNEQIKGKQQRIHNRKARKRPIVPKHTEALQLAQDALNRIQELIEGQKRGTWYRDSTLFDKVNKLRDIDKETNSPMLQQTEELFTLIRKFTEIPWDDFELLP